VPISRHHRRAVAALEAMLALVLAGVGVLALAAVGTLALALTDDGAARDHAALAARRAIDSLLATPCAALAPGADSVGAARISWTVADTGDLRTLREQVRFPLRGATRTVLYEQGVGCRAP
jgi:Tfp pilus assembly protein PilV